MEDFEIWRRITISSRAHPPVQDARHVYVPMIEPVAGLPYELAGLLPNREHSRDLMVLIDGLPENVSGQRSVVGVFAADPFLNCKRIADRLIAKGYRSVTNIPPVTAYGCDFLATLDKVASGQLQEQHNMGRLVNRGLSILPAVAAIECLPAALDFSPRRLWLVPSFDMWQGEAIRSDLLLKLCHEVTRLTDIPVVLAAGQTGITATDASGAGARGMLMDGG